MTQSTASNPPLLDPGLGDCLEKILLPPTDPNAEVMEISVYKLVYVGGAIYVKDSALRWLILPKKIDSQNLVTPKK